MSVSKKLVFKPAQIAKMRNAVELDVLPSYQKGLDPSQAAHDLSADSKQAIVEEYRGPTIEEIERELEEYRKQQYEKIQDELAKAHQQAEKIEEDGKTAAFNLLQEAREKAKQEQESAQLNAEQMVERAKLEVERMIKEADMRVAETEHKAYEKGYRAGQEEGYQEGQKEVKRLVERLGVIVGQAIDTREELISSSERQMVEMILMIARKILKDEIAERKEIVLNNTREALKRLRDREEVSIRVNLADLELTTAHKEEFINMIESLHKINVFEDSRVDHGGCIIETDAGSIDARISTQLKQMEEAVRNIEPV